MNIPSHPKYPRYIANIGKLAQPLPADRGLPDKPVRIFENIWIEITDGRIHRIGPEEEPFPIDVPADSVFDAAGFLATPGLIDAHTHPVFAGTRQNEFIRRCRGETYQQIAATGGGILSSVRKVRSASEEQLTKTVRRHLDRFLEFGITTVEGKSGYGLTFDDEMKMLRALKTAAGDHPVDVSPTLLAAHVVPPEYTTEPDKYVDLVCDKMIPYAAENGLAEAVDVFLERGAYTLEQARRIFEAGKGAGLMLRIHADQFTSGGGAELAAEFKALSADHMDRTTDDGYQALAEAGVTVTLLPGAVFFLGLEQYAPVRRIIDLGCRIALSTDFNPGSTPTQSLTLMMTLACIKMGLSPDEAFWAVTVGAATAIGRENRIGTVEPGYDADICLWDAEDVAYIPYAYGDMIPEVVFKRGEWVAWRGNRLNKDMKNNR